VAGLLSRRKKEGWRGQEGGGGHGGGEEEEEVVEEVEQLSSWSSSSSIPSASPGALLAAAAILARSPGARARHVDALRLMRSSRGALAEERETREEKRGKEESFCQSIEGK